MRYALFLGCTIPARGQNYEMSAREIAKVLNIKLVDFKEFACCGTPLRSSQYIDSIILAARNIAIVSEYNLDICTLCSSCTSVLTEVNIELNENKLLRDKVNKELKKIGKEFKPGVKIKHFSRILYEDVGIKKIQTYVKNNLKKLRLSIHYGCHYLRPTHIYQGFEDAENPTTIDQLIAATGATIVNYKDKLACCGGAILGVEQDIALSMAKKKLDNVCYEKADALVTCCPFCTVMYQDNQRKIESNFEIKYDLPVLFFSQVLGLAFGIDQKKLGFRLNKVKANALLEKIGVE
jgi:heterodisulfide reductase subunit B